MANRTRDTANLTSDTNLYVDTLTDRVGVGTTSPSDKLHVVGGLMVTGTIKDSSGDTGTEGQFLLSTGTGTNWASVSSSSAAVTISEDNNASTPRYPVFEDITSGTVETLHVSPSKLQFIPSSGTLSATVFTSLSDRTQKEDIRPIENSI